MFRIGDFSRIARVSCRLLRYYDELGLLKPANVERDTGYRYYSAAQLSRLNRILVLKELGLNLDEVARILDQNLSPAELRGMLLMRRTEIESALSMETERLRRVEMRIAQIDSEGELAHDDVVVRAEPAHRVLSTRRLVSSFAEARELLREVSMQIRKAAPRDALRQLIAIAHAGEFEPDRLDVEIGFTLRCEIGPIENSMEAAVRELPATAHLAACVRVGPPEHAHLITARIGQFVEANGYRLCGPSRELFLQPPRFDRMEESVVEMQFPIERIASTPGLSQADSSADAPA